MKQNLFPRWLAASITALLSVICAVPAASAQAQPGDAASIRLPGYFQDILDSNIDPPLSNEVGCTAIRDDLGIERIGAPMDVDEYARLLSGLGLKKSPEGTTIAVKAPFTLRFTFGNQTDAFSFTAKGVLYNGDVYTPSNPGALESFYLEDREKFFSAEFYRLGRDLNFSADLVASVDLKRSHYQDEISMRLTSRDTISALLAEQKEILARRTGSDEEIMAAAGASMDKTVYYLRDGTAIGLEYGGGTLRLQKGNQAEVPYLMLIGGMGGNGRSLFDELINAYPGVPQITVSLAGRTPETVYSTDFEYDGNAKAYHNDVPQDYYYDKHLFLPIRPDNKGKLSFNEQASRTTAQLFRMEKYRENRIKDPGQPVDISPDGSFALPGEPGIYCLRVNAVFPKGKAGYFVGFTVSDLPEFFDDISYGNEDGNVTLSRDDLGRSVVCGQNRMYVQWIKTLDLVPDDDSGSWPLSQVKKPFSLTFRCEGYPEQRFEFRTADSKVIFNGKVYRARNVDAFQTLYSPGDTMTGGSILMDVKGFLTAETTTFSALYPIQIQEVASVREERKRLYRRSESTDDKGNTTYNFELDTLSSRELDSSGFAKALEKIGGALLVKEEQNADAYDYGEYIAYTLTLKDGRSFLLDRRLIIGGENSGYMIIPDEKYGS